MKIFTLFIFLTSITFSQWTPLNPINSSPLYSMYFTDDNNGWIAGSKGAILKFNSQKFLWEQQPKYTSNDLLSIGFFDNLNGITCGKNGTLLRTTDGGTTWFTPVLGLTAHFHKIQIFNNKTAYLAGSSGTLMKTNDRGITWKQILPPSVSYFTSVFFIDEKFGFWGSADSKIFRTTDGGESWTETIIPSYYSLKVNDIQFIDTLTGYAGGGTASQSGSFYYKTTNGGLTWSHEFGTNTVHDIFILKDGWGLVSGGNSTWDKFMLLKSPTGYSTIMSRTEDYDIYCVWITPSGQGWAAGGAGSIYYASDFKSNWNYVYSGSLFKPLSIGCSKDYFIIGAEYNTYGTEDPVILRGTFDSLLTKYILYTYMNIYSVNLNHGNSGYLGDGGDMIIKTTDKGLTWNFNVTPPAEGSRLYFFNDAIGWRFFEYFDGLYKTIDSGKIWVNKYPNFKPVSISFADSNNGYVCSKTQLKRTSNGGNDWIDVTLPFSGDLKLLSFITPEKGIIAGASGILYITEDAGLSWRNINPGSYSTVFNGLEILNNEIIVVSTSDGYVLKSSDFGNKWSGDYLGISVLNLASDKKENLMIRTVNNVYVNKVNALIPVELTEFSASVILNKVKLNWQTSTELNNNGFEIQKKINDNWITIGFVKGKGTSTELNKYSFTEDITTNNNVETVYRLKQVDFSGSFSYSKEVKVFTGIYSYELFQNYPNPFNPSTTIKFSLSNEVQTNLTVFNLLGEKVVELKNEIMKPGCHEVEFKSSDLPSGIYFYKLQAGEYIQTRKMLLIK